MKLADLVAAELGDAPARRDAPPPMARLREAGRELDVPVPCRVGDQVGVILTTLDRTAVIEYADGDRRVVGADRVQVDAADVRWRPAQVVPWGYEAINTRPVHAHRRGRGIQVAPKRTVATAG